MGSRFIAPLAAVALVSCGRVGPGGEPRSVVVQVAARGMGGASSASVARDAPPPSAAPTASATAPAPEPAAPEDDGTLPWPPGYVPPRIWERRSVVVDGVNEQWFLRWREAPRFNGCTPDVGYCACFGMEWGLAGELELVRARPGEPEEVLDLAAISDGPANIPGFRALPDDAPDYDVPEGQRRAAATLTQAVKRPRVRVMDLADYDHDGRATEFVFTIGYLACGQQPNVLVGISRAVPTLHVFGTAEDPAAWIVMTYRDTWGEIRRAKASPKEVALQECGDHGGNGSYLGLAWDSAGFHVVDQSEWDCDFTQTPPRRRVRLPPGQPR